MAGGGWLIEVVIAGSRAQLMHVMIKPITEGGSSSVGAGAGSGGGDHGVTGGFSHGEGAGGHCLLCISPPFSELPHSEEREAREAHLTDTCVYPGLGLQVPLGGGGLGASLHW